MSQIIIQNLSFTYEGDHTPVFQGLNLHLDTNWKLGLLGRNGRGKTTLLRLLEGSLEGQGVISCSVPRRYYPKIVWDPSQTTRRVLSEAAPDRENWQLIRELSRLGMGEEVLDRPFSTLSGGEQTKALLAALFLDHGVWPILDEPTNHLDVRGRDQVAEYLQGQNCGFLVVSHDRSFLDRCVDHILALNQTGPELVRGNFSTWFQEKEARDRSELAQNEKLKGEIKRLHQSSLRTSDWSGQVEETKYATKNSGLRPDRGYIGHKSAKMMKRAKHIEARQEKAVQEKAALLKDLERADPLRLTPAVHPSRRLLEGRDLSVAFDGRTVCSGISFTVCQGDRICLSGGNGSGKTSLLRLCLGEQAPDSGSLWRASGLKISYVPQNADFLSGSLLNLADVQGIDLTRFLTILRKLDFSRALFERSMEEYSAGHKKKVLLAASLCQSAHLYVWDEPLNYIDLFSRMQIEELLLDAPITLL
ncbi:MAG: ATP-binding cassette domain-containing protein, partial [Lawsonibacter sp.]|nr:ATP-binding cassette domain-containing protein [Lawsonibacter sp.]